MDNNKKKRITKIILIVGTLVLIISTINIVLTIGAKKMIKKDLITLVSKSTDGLYSLSTGDLHINLLSGFVSVQNISLDLDSIRLSELYLADSLPRYYGSIHIQELNFYGLDFRYRENPKKRKFLLSCIDIIHPQVNIIDNEEGITTDNPKENVVKLKNRTPYEMIAPYFDLLSISTIRMRNGVLNFSSEKKKDTTTVHLENINIEAQGFRIDSSAEKRSYFLYSDDFYLRIDSTKIEFPDKLYSLSSGEIKASASDSLLIISDVAYVSNISKWEFAYHAPNHTDWMDVRVGELKLKGVHISKYVEDKIILMDSILCSDIFFRNYKNKKIVRPRNLVPMIYEPVQKFPIPFSVGYLKTSNINIEYEELDKKGIKPGFVNFTQMEGVFDEGITNIISSHTQTNKLEASGKLMDEGLINAVLHFPVDSTYDHVRIKGTLGTMNMIILNNIIEPLAPLKIDKGFIQGMDYSIEGGREKATIDMCLRYNDLNVQILIPTGEVSRSNQGILSFLVNGLIENNNPGKDEVLRRAQTEQVRDPYRSSFNYLWKIYLSGLVETVGFTKERQKNVKWLKENLN